MSFKELDTVVLDRDLPEHHLKKGDLGAVVQVCPQTVWMSNLLPPRGVRRLW